MNLRYIITSVLLLLFTLHGFSQEQAEESEKKNLLAVLPSYVMFRGLRVEYERKISDRSWLLLSPTFHYSRTRFREMENFYGAGGGIAYKWQIIPMEEQTGSSYIAFEANYNYFNSEYSTMGFVEETRAGIPVLVYRDTKPTEEIHRGKLAIIVGRDWINKPFLLGLFASVIYQASNITTSTGMQIREHDSLFDFGYSGFSYNIGLRFGGIF